MSQRKHYGNIERAETKGVAQVDPTLRKQYSVEISEPVLRMAYKEYARQYGNDQSYERMQQRGGLSVLEVVGLLADYVERIETQEKQKAA